MNDINPEIKRLLESTALLNKVDKEDWPLLLKTIKERIKLGQVDKETLKQIATEINKTSPAKHAEYLIAASHCVTTPRKTLWEYENGVYKKNEFDLDVAINSLLSKTPVYGPEVTNLMTITKKRKISQEVAAKTGINMADFDHDTGCINILSGMINVRQQKVQPHSAKHLSTIQFPISYDPDAKCPKFDKWLTNFCLSNKVQNKRHENLIWQMIAMILYPHTGIQTMWAFYGQGNNGKGTLLNVIRMLVGEHYSAVTWLELIEGDSFILSDMVGKVVNIDGDVDAIAASKFGLVKRIVGQDPIRVNEKFKPAYATILHITLVMSFNSIPQYKMSYAFARRLQLLPIFTQIAPEKVKINYHKNFEDELPGIFNKALSWLYKMLKTGKIEGAYSPETIITIMSETSGDIVTNVLHTLFVSDEKGSLRMAEIQSAVQERIQMMEFGISEDELSKMTNSTKLGRTDLLRHAKIPNSRPVAYRLEYKDNATTQETL